MDIVEIRLIAVPWILLRSTITQLDTVQGTAIAIFPLSDPEMDHTLENDLGFFKLLYKPKYWPFPPPYWRSIGGLVSGEWEYQYFNPTHCEAGGNTVYWNKALTGGEISGSAGCTFWFLLTSLPKAFLSSWGYFWFKRGMWLRGKSNRPDSRDQWHIHCECESFKYGALSEIGWSGVPNEDMNQE